MPMSADFAAAVAQMAAGELEELLAEELSKEGRVTVPLDSSCLSSASYDTDGRLSVTMTADGSEWEYPPGTVSPREFLELITAPSAGRYWNLNIRGRGR